MEQYNCPECHCGSLFEDRGKLICMNCGCECSLSAARSSKHVHQYETYASQAHGHAGKETKKVVSSQSSYTRTAGYTKRSPSASSSGSTFPAGKTSKGSAPKGCGCMVVAFLLIAAIFFFTLLREFI